jgi:hypothetical protein
MTWIIQTINNRGNSEGTIAADAPFVSVYNGQQHFGYRDQNGTIFDSWYDPSRNKWNFQKINNGGNTIGPIAINGPFIGVYHDQQHFSYIDSAGTIWDSWYDGHNKWNLQRINTGGHTNGPPAEVARIAGRISVWTDPSNTQQHFTYTAIDLAVYDAFWDQHNWHLQKINSGGKTGGPPASSSPFGAVFDKQQHIAYQGANGDIMDSWYDGNGHWSLQKINNGGNTNGPPAFAGTRPFLWVDSSNTQQHFTYLASDQGVYDAFWDGNDWKLQKINVDGVTNGPASAGAPTACVFFRGNQHICYRDSQGNLWDAFYDGTHWNLEKINSGAGTQGMTNAPAASSDAFLWVANTQIDVNKTDLHFTFVDAVGTIWDTFLDMTLGKG